MWKQWILQSVYLISVITYTRACRCDNHFDICDPCNLLRRTRMNDRTRRYCAERRMRKLQTLPSAINKNKDKPKNKFQPTTKATTQRTVSQPTTPTTNQTANQTATQPTFQPAQRSNAPFLPENQIERIIMSMGVFGLTAVLFNCFVICRVAHKAINAVAVHKSKYFFLSLAFADVYYGIFCLSYTLVRFEVIYIEDNAENRQIEKIWRETSVILSLNASLYHVLMITLDRYLATAFPLFHKVHVSRCKISIVIISSWVLAISLAVLPLCTKSYLISEWFYFIIGCFGLFLLITTYTHIIIVIFKRWCQLKKQSKKKNKVNMSEKSISTTIFSIIITITYICCMSVTFLHQTNIVEVIFIKFLLYSINATVNPIFYSIIDYVRSIVVKKRKKKCLENEPLKKK